MIRKKKLFLVFRLFLSIMSGELCCHELDGGGFFMMACMNQNSFYATSFDRTEKKFNRVKQ
jgi:hypothetical protein